MAFSLYISFGKNKGLKFLEKDGPSIRIRLWVVVFCFSLVDIEKIIRDLLNELKNKDVRQDLINEDNIIQKQQQVLKEKNGKDKIFDETIKVLQDAIENITEKLEESTKKEQEMKEYIDDLELEIADLSDVSNENEEFKKEIDELENQLSHKIEEIEYMEIYFGIC